VVAGQVIILLVIQTGAVVLLARMSPLRFLRGIREAMLVAFSTSSSNATLPVTMQCCEQNLGISNEVASFVAPLGATVNMNGTALYQGVAACFIAQVYQHPLTLGDQVSIVVAATLAAVGTAGVPGVGIVTLAMVLRSAGLPVQGIALVLGVDRLLDMVRTVTNITGDCACAAVVAASEGELRTPRHGA
jgi:Na+/H+-dicarboxylate symporter